MEGNVKFCPHRIKLECGSGKQLIIRPITEKAPKIMKKMNSGFFMVFNLPNNMISEYGYFVKYILIPKISAGANPGK
jgi:hypothetical protein